MNMTEAANGQPLRVALYCRISTPDQHLENQLQELRQVAAMRKWPIVHAFSDTASGATRERPGLDALMKEVRAGKVDVVATVRLDRLGRSLSHLLRLLDELSQCGVAFIATAQGIDSTSDTGKLILSILGALSEYERSLILERVKAGIHAARARGVRFGRPRVGFDIAAVVRMRKQGISVREVARTVGVSPATVFRVLRSLEQSGEGAGNAPAGAAKACGKGSETEAQP